MTLLVTPDKLADWLLAHNGGSRITAVTMLTPVKMNKYHRETGEPNPWMVDGESMVDHLQERIALLGADYAAMVNRNWDKCLAPNQEGYIPLFQAAAIWQGKGVHLNPYIVQHTDKGCLYLATYHTRIKAESWIDKSLKAEGWFHRLTGTPVDRAEFAGWLPPPRKASAKQACQEGAADLELDIDGEEFVIPAGINPREVGCRFPHLENVLTLRSFDLRKRGEYEVIQVARSPFQIST